MTRIAGRGAGVPVETDAGARLRLCAGPEVDTIAGAALQRSRRRRLRHRPSREGTAAGRSVVRVKPGGLPSGRPRALTRPRWPVNAKTLLKKHGCLFSTRQGAARGEVGGGLFRRRIGSSRASWRVTKVPGERCRHAQVESSSSALGFRPSRPDSGAREPEKQAPRPPRRSRNLRQREARNLGQREAQNLGQKRSGPAFPEYR